MPRRNSPFLLALVVALGGCVTPPAPPPPPVPVPAAALESHEPFFAADKGTGQAVGSLATAQRMLDDGRLEALITLSNRTEKPFAGEMVCVFKDAAGAASEPTPEWRKVTLAPHAAETLRFTSADAKAKSFTLVLR